MGKVNDLKDTAKRFGEAGKAIHLSQQLGNKERWVPKTLSEMNMWP